MEFQLNYVWRLKVDGWIDERSVQAVRVPYLICNMQFPINPRVVDEIPNNTMTSVASLDTIAVMGKYKMRRQRFAKMCHWWMI